MRCHPQIQKGVFNLSSFRARLFSKTSISSLQIQSPGSGLSVSDNEFSAKDSSRFSSSSSTSDFNSEDEEDTLFLEDLPVSIPSQLDDRYSEAPPGMG